MPDGSSAARDVSSVLEFRPRPAQPRCRNRLGPCERIEASDWAMIAQPQGFTRVLIHDSGCDDPEIGDFLLIYESGHDWASWGVARDLEGFVVWRAGSGETIGRYDLLREALDAVLAQPVQPARRIAAAARARAARNAVPASVLPLR